MKKYGYIKDLTSDVAFRAWGKDYKELFENSGLALSSIICKTDKLKLIRKIKLTAEGEDYESLLFNFLQQIIAAVDTDEIFLREFKVTKISKNKVIAVCKGEEIRPELGYTVVKAITKHKFELSKQKDGKQTVFVTVDI
jgi:SHS2 domain-containing protein